MSGCLIAAFLLLHMANHIAMFWGQERHIAVMEALRPIYRAPLVEALLMAALLFQIGSGLAMVWRTRRERSGLIDRAQAISGIVLFLFIANHVIAIWWGRLSLGLDTNFHFAAAGMHAGLAWFFVPYYALGVAALFVHLACALSWRMEGSAAPLLLAGVGAVLAIGFVTVMAGDDAIPARYLDAYR